MSAVSNLHKKTWKTKERRLTLMMTTMPVAGLHFVVA